MARRNLPKSVRSILKAKGPAEVERCVAAASGVADALSALLAEHREQESDFEMTPNELVKAGNYFLALKDAMTPDDDGEIYATDLEGSA